MAARCMIGSAEHVLNYRPPDRQSASRLEQDRQQMRTSHLHAAGSIAFFGVQ